MFAIKFENEIYKQWSCEYVFDSFELAKEYLITSGFTEKNRLFVRENYKWSKYIKAYIAPIKIYTKEKEGK